MSGKGKDEDKGKAKESNPLVTEVVHHPPRAAHEAPPPKASLHDPSGSEVEDEEVTEARLAAASDKNLGEMEFVESEPLAENKPPARRRQQALVPAGQRSLALRDPLQAYINEARRYPLLDREQERTLALRYSEGGDLDAARRLVTSNLRLVVKIAHEYRKACRNVLDLVQEGNIGLMHAVKKFDPHRGVKLSTYAAWWIRAYILKYILNNWRMVKIGTTQHQRKLFFNLRKEMERLRQEGVDSPAPKLLAERLDVPEHEVRSMQQRLSGGDVSLDAPMGSDDSGSASRIDFVTTEHPGPEAQVEEAQFSRLVREKVAEFGKTLTGRDREIFDLRTVAEEPLTLQQLGDHYGISRERARQVERRVMDRLRDYLRAELKDSVDIALGTSGEK